MAKFTVSFTLNRDDGLRADDESWFDCQHINDEIQRSLFWLEDLDFDVSNIEVKERGDSLCLEQ